MRPLCPCPFQTATILGAPLAAQQAGLYSCWLPGLEGTTSVLHDDPRILRDLQPALSKSFHFLSMNFFLALLGVDAKCQGSKITGSVLWLQHRDGGRAWLPRPGSSFPCKEQSPCHASRGRGWGGAALQVGAPLVTHLASDPGMGVLPG